MPVIVVTRLRLRDEDLLDEFFTHAVAAIEQATKTEGNLGVDALAEANNTWWSVSAWRGRDRMQAFVETDPHLSTEELLDHLCDEATFVDWEQDSPDLPDWQTNWRHLVADGKSATLTNESAANQTRAFPPPVEAPPSDSLCVSRITPGPADGKREGATWPVAGSPGQPRRIHSAGQWLRSRRLPRIHAAGRISRREKQ